MKPKYYLSIGLLFLVSLIIAIWAQRGESVEVNLPVIQPQPPKRTERSQVQTNDIPSSALPGIPSGRGVDHSELARLLMNDLRECDLRPEQADCLVAELALFLDVKNELDQRYASQASWDGASLVVTVSPYPDEGLALRKALFSSLKDKFDASTYERVKAQFDKLLCGVFEGYGNLTKRVTIRRSDKTSGELFVEFRAILDPENLPRIRNGEFAGGYRSAYMTVAEFSGSEVWYLEPFLKGKF